MRIAADFETTTKSPARVWLWGAVGIDEQSEETGDCIETFFEYLEKLPKNPLVYFHNLKFDGYFILDYLLRSGFQWVASASDVVSKSFTTIIDGYNEFYQISVYFKKTKSGKVKKCTIWDSLKVLKFSIDDIPRKFGFSDIKKGSIDYHRHNKPCFITPDEVEYCLTDCRILARALAVLSAHECESMTIALCALNDYKAVIGKKNFQKWFPCLPYEVDCELRQAYRGGWCYANPFYIGKTVGPGFVFDQNAKYGFVMNEKPLPFGDPVRFCGEYPENSEYPLYIQHIRCMFRLKDGYLPFIQIKRNPDFMPTEYVRDSARIVDLWLCSPEINLFFEHYEVTNIEYLDGYMFKASCDLFKSYVQKWNELKEEGETTGNKGLRMLGKTMIVSLYGKFSRNPERRTCFPVMTDANQVSLQLLLHPQTDEDGHTITETYEDPETGELYEMPALTDTEIIEAGYIPTACFVTSWGRAEEVAAAQKLHFETMDEYGNSDFLYADTDSLHTLGDAVPDFLDIDPARLGAWKVESRISRARYLQSKRYIMEIENPDGKTELKCVCAGMPAEMQKRVTFDGFSLNAIYHGRKVQKIVPGGVILEEDIFTLK